MMIPTNINFCQITYYLILAIVVYLVQKYVRLYLLLTQKVTKYPETIELEERFSKEKIPKRVDYIIIGSGPGGLVSGAILSKLGKKVLVLEQHSVAGGCLHNFGQKKGFLFDTGMHYLGDRSDYQSILNLVISKPIEWNHIANYDTVRINNDALFPLFGPEDKYYANLKAKFPEAEAQINQFRVLKNRAIKLINLIFVNALIMPKFLHNIVISILKYFFSDVFGKTTKEILDKYKISPHKKLSIILQAQLGDCGCLPSQCPFVMNIGLLDHFCNGAVYPVGGTHKIAESLVHTIRHFGGTVLTRAAVTKIIVSGKGEVEGVEVCGQTIKSAKIISNAGARMTVSLVPEPLQWKIPLGDSISHFFCFVGIQGEFNFPSCNIWHYQVGEELDMDKAMRNYREKQDFNFMSSFTSFCSAKAKIQGDKHSCVVLCEASTEWVMKYRETILKRKEGYKEYKKSIQKILIDRLVSQFPEIKDHIVKIKIGTPLTSEYYFGRFASHGLEITNERIISKDMAMSTTPIKGLYQVGEDTTIMGVSAAILNGFLTALRVEKFFW